MRRVVSLVWKDISLLTEVGWDLASIHGQGRLTPGCSCWAACNSPEAFIEAWRWGVLEAEPTRTSDIVPKPIRAAINCALWTM